MPNDLVTLFPSLKYILPVVSNEDVITTEEEIEGFYIIKSILAEIIDIDYNRMRVDVRLLSRGEMVKIEQEGKRSKDKDTLMRVVSLGYKPKNRKQYSVEELRDMDSGFLKSLYDEINFVSGTPIDGFTQLAVKQAFTDDS